MKIKNKPLLVTTLIVFGLIAMSALITIKVFGVVINRVNKPWSNDFTPANNGIPNEILGYKVLAVITDANMPCAANNTVNIVIEGNKISDTQLEPEFLIPKQDFVGYIREHHLTTKPQISMEYVRPGKITPTEVLINIKNSSDSEKDYIKRHGHCVRLGLPPPSIFDRIASFLTGK